MPCADARPRRVGVRAVIHSEGQSAAAFAGAGAGFFEPLDESVEEPPDDESPDEELLDEPEESELPAVAALAPLPDRLSVL